MISSVYTQAARTRTCKSYKDAELFIAWATGNPEWGEQVQQSGTFTVGGLFDVGRILIADVTLAPLADQEALFVEGIDYSVNYGSGIISKLGGGSIGDIDVIAKFTVRTPPASVADGTLIGEVGRRRALLKSYVNSDPGGSIVTDAGRYSVSATPTRNLYVEVTFAMEDSPGAVIRQLGLFADTVISEGLPEGQQYFLPGQIEDAGTLIQIVHRPAIIRNETARETFFLVLSL